LIRKAQVRGEVRPHARNLRLVERHHDAGGALWGGEMIAIDIELVLLGLTAEDRMLIEHQDRAVGAPLAISAAGGHASDATTDDNDIRSLASIDRRPQRLVEFLVTDPPVRGVHYLVSVAVGPAVIAYATRSGPVRSQPRHFRGDRL